MLSGCWIESALKLEQNDLKWAMEDSLNTFHPEKPLWYLKSLSET